MYIGCIKDSNGIVHKDYNKYLNSKHWKNKKEQFAKVYANNCVVCGKDERLHLHHITYDRVGNENLDDLCYLCDKCHSYVHSGVEELPIREILNTFKIDYINKNRPKQRKISKEEKIKLNEESKKRKLEKIKSKKEKIIKEEVIKNTSFELLTKILETQFDKKSLKKCHGRFKIFGNGKYQIKCIDLENNLIIIRNTRTKLKSNYKIIQ